MGKALESLKKLQLRNEQIKSAHPVVVKPKQLIDLATKLSRVVNNIKDIPASQTIEMLFEKAKNIYLFEDGTFTAREKRNLPFILPSSRPISGMVDFVFENIDFQRFSSFKRILFVYFQSYKDKDSLTLKLRKKILSVLHGDNRKKNISYLYNDAELIKASGIVKMAEQFKNDLRRYFDEISFPVALRHSPFAHQAIIYYFEKIDIDLSNKMDMLRIIHEDDADKTLIPRIAESMIFAVHHEGKQSYRDALLHLLHQEMGDPRYSTKRVAWSRVSDKAKKIFISWLKRGDLDLFFSIIDRTMHSDVNSQVDARRMWHDRKIFWEQYLDQMYYTKVVLAPEAARIARREYGHKVLDYGNLNSNNKNQSLFVFSIGKYVFIEPSYNGTLRIWKLDCSPVPLASELKKYNLIDYSVEIVHSSKQVDTFVHSRSWQQRVHEWIIEHCW